MEVLARLGVAVMELLEPKDIALQRRPAPGGGAGDRRGVAGSHTGRARIPDVWAIPVFGRWFGPGESAMLVGVIAWLAVVIGLLAVRGILGGRIDAGSDDG